MRNRVIPLVAAVGALLLTGCVAEVAPPRVAVVARPAEVYVPAPPPPVVSVYVEPPISQPPPVAIGWAPPPLLVESPPPPPFEGAVWVGGYWVWQGDWVWAHGHWVGAPRPGYVWVHPYYEHRDGVVLFITGHWSPPGAVFVPPPPGIHLTVEVAAAGVIAGPRPMGPDGCFIPPPPGSRPGIIIPAPIGTAPAVVTGAPPVVAVGMRVTNTVNNTTNNVTDIRNVTNVTNVTNVKNITNVTIVAPPGTTANGLAVNTSVPAQAHLAAAQAAVVKAQAPEPASPKPIPAFVHGKAFAPLPPAQAVNTAPSGAKAMHVNMAHPDRPPTARGQQENAPAVAKRGERAPAESPQRGQHVEVAQSNGKTGAMPVGAGNPGNRAENGNKGEKGNRGEKGGHTSGEPANAQLAATRAKSNGSAGHPNGAVPSAKAKPAQAGAKKDEHNKKSEEKEEQHAR